MKFSDGIKMAFRDLGKRKGRTFLTSLAVAIGSMLIVTMVGLGTTAEQYIMEQFKKQSTAQQVNVIPMKYMKADQQNETQSQDMSEEERAEQTAKNFKKIDDDTLNNLKNISGTSDVVGVITTYMPKVKIAGKESTKNSNISLNGFSSSDKIFNKEDVEGIKVNKKLKTLNPILEGRSLNDSDKNGVLVNQKLLKTMGISDYKSVVGTEIILTDNSNPLLKPIEIKAKIIGVVDENLESNEYTNTIITSKEFVSKVKSNSLLLQDSFKEKGYDNAIIYGKSASDVKNIGQAVSKLGYMYVSQEQIAGLIKSALTTVEQILSILGLIVLFVAALGTMNTMTMAIHERTKTIGIMKAVGASRQNIHKIFLLQAGAIGFIGGIMGLIFSFINGKIIEIVLAQYLSKQGVKETINFSFPAWLVFGTLAFAIGISLISGIYPARKASKLDAIEALNS
jgi:putative ABC transport system permease protein